MGGGLRVPGGRAGFPRQEPRREEPPGWALRSWKRALLTVNGTRVLAPGRQPLALGRKTSSWGRGPHWVLPGEIPAEVQGRAAEAHRVRCSVSDSAGRGGQPPDSPGTPEGLASGLLSG